MIMIFFVFVFLKLCIINLIKGKSKSTLCLKSMCYENVISYKNKIESFKIIKKCTLKKMIRNFRGRILMRVTVVSKKNLEV